MSDATPTMTRYLLGELSEDERSALEEAYFADADLLAQVADAESALVDDYVRGRLGPELRMRFEQVYLSDPRRRARVTFAAALATTLDDAQPRVAAGSPTSWLRALFASRPALRWSLASLLVLAIAAGGAWFVRSSRRQESTAASGPPVTAPPPASATPVTPEPPRPPVAAVPPAILALAVGPGVRGIDPTAPSTLVVPAGTSEVRLELNLEERDFTRYRVLLRAVGGAEVLRRGGLAPAAERSGPAFTFVVPASQLPSGDYVLTLQGARGGEFEDLSQSLFHVERR